MEIQVPRIRIAAVAAAIAALVVPAAASAQAPSQSPDQVLMAMAQQRAAATEQLVKSQTDAIKVRNEQIARLQQQLVKLRANPAANAAQIKAVEQQIQALNSSAQLDMIRLQALVNKQNQTHEMLSNMLKKAATTQQAIVRNIRP